MQLPHLLHAQRMVCDKSALLISPVLMNVLSGWTSEPSYHVYHSPTGWFETMAIISCVLQSVIHCAATRRIYSATNIYLFFFPVFKLFFFALPSSTVDAEGFCVSPTRFTRVASGMHGLNFSWGWIMHGAEQVRWSW